jgi:flagellar basal-body rod modification protein FlgD
MSGSIQPTTPGAAPASGNAVSQTGTTALGSLTSNFSDFLSLLMTQLQHQDPSSPMDASQFTSELVQFSSVEQQINTNGNLTQLIQLTQASRSSSPRR